MNHVATLISNPTARVVDAAAIERACSVLPGASDPLWLDPAVAADIPFSAVAPIDQRALADALRAAIGDRPLDVVVQPVARRRKRLFLADMDSTMIGQECIDELADLLGVKARVAAITERAMRGEIAFEPALRERVALLKGLPVGVVDEIIATRIQLTPGGPALVGTMRAHGGHTCLVSGGFTVFTSRIAEMIGFHENRANVLEIADGHFAGTVREPILGQEAKLATLRELTSRLGLTREDTLAVGDGANDIPMLENAGLGVAFHGKPAVASIAGMRVEHGDLTALLYAQGYQRDEFSTPK